MVAVLVLLGLTGCGDRSASYDLLSERSPDGRQIALVRVVPCGATACESLWVGSSPDDAVRVVVLPHGEEQCTDIAWSRDGKRVAFLINGYQLRLYDAQTHAPAGLLDLLPADASPSSRVARGVTFSDNGAAITFDDCPRERSGCRPGMVAVR
jgi:hypothetical protein